MTFKKEYSIAIIVVLAIVISVGYTYYKTIIQEDFEVVNIEE